MEASELPRLPVEEAVVEAPVPVEVPIIPINLTESETILLNSLTITERLLISQAVFEFGNSDFKSVAKTLQGHKLLNNRSKHFFNPDKCSKVFLALMNELGIDGTIPYPPNAAPLLKLARKNYMMRVVELRKAMQLEQDRFRIQFSEIQQIKDGSLDHLMESEFPASSSSYSSQSKLPSLSALPPLPKTSGSSSKKSSSISLPPLIPSTSTLVSAVEGESTPTKRGRGRGRARGSRGVRGTLGGRGSRGKRGGGVASAASRGAEESGEKEEEVIKGEDDGDIEGIEGIEGEDGGEDLGEQIENDEAGGEDVEMS